MEKNSQENVFSITQEQVEDYLRGVSDRSRGHYRYSLTMFYSWLPDDKTVDAARLEAWREHLIKEGYADSTINARLSACNNLMEYLGRRDLQVTRLKSRENQQPELTRGEYLRLLEAANALGQDTEYMMIKLFAAAGLSMEGVQNLTVEEIGELDVPDFIQQELEDYARRHGRASGYLFITRSGRTIDRAAIRSRINRLSQTAQVESEKANPRCLQRLYRTTMESVHSDAEYVVRRYYYRMLESEHVVVTWPKPRR